MTDNNKTLPFGTWPSPLSARRVTTAGVRLGDVMSAGGCSFWAETRPDEQSRCTIVKSHEGDGVVDCFAAPFNARTRVHEYGGGAWWVDSSMLYFVNWEDQRLYRVSHVDRQAEPEPVTHATEEAQSLRFADGCVSPDGKWIVCVRESHQAGVEAVNEVVAIANTRCIESETEQHLVLASGADFYSTPRLSDDGKWLSWIQWSHPQMPWDGTELRVAAVGTDMNTSSVKRIAGSSTESIMGAFWSHDGSLVYASDKSGWWNLYRTDSNAAATTALTSFTDREVGTPAWVFGTQRFVEVTSSDAKQTMFALLVTHNAKDQLVLLSNEGHLTPLSLPFVSVQSIVADESGNVILHAAGVDEQASILKINCAAHGASASDTTTQSEQGSENEDLSNFEILRPADKHNLDKGWISKPEFISFPSNGRVAHAFFYPPTAEGVDAPAAEKPPLVVMGHGGPTSHSVAALKLSIQYWTSRGVAVVDVNYGGSSGFGREYRRLLNGQWGVVDVEDCIAAARFLATENRVDAKRMVIRGGSAGGLTVLRALQTSDRFAGGTSLYGVTDLELLAGDTHKFESRYLDGLLGGPYPEFKTEYQARSPIHHTDKLNCPILVMQGEDDKVVPPNQSAAIVDAAADKGLPHAYILFAGEQHGFRQTDNIIRALQIELWFYGRVLGFTPADKIDAPREAVGL